MIQRFRQLSLRRKAIAIVILVLAASGVVLGAVRLGKRSPTVPTYDVKRGEFLDSLQFRGEVKALKSVTIACRSGRPADHQDFARGHNGETRRRRG